MAAKREALIVAESTWSAEFNQAQAKRNDVLKRLSNQRTVTEQIIKLREGITEYTNQIRELEEQLRIQREPSKQLEEAMGLLGADQRRARSTHPGVGGDDRISF